MSNKSEHRFSAGFAIPALLIAPAIALTLTWFNSARSEQTVIGCKPTETGVSLVMKNGEEKPNSRWRVDRIRGICYASNGGNTPPETLPLLKP